LFIPVSARLPACNFPLFVPAAPARAATDPGTCKTDCGNHTITVHALSPGDIPAARDFKVKP
jgi:hypothetical protein